MNNNIFLYSKLSFVLLFIVIVVTAAVKHDDNNKNNNKNNALKYRTTLTIHRHNMGDRGRRYLQQEQQNVAGSNTKTKFFDNQEQLMFVENIPKEINVDPRSTYNDKFMALMNSPCRPEPDGYFGATFGEPLRLQYGFQLEIQPLSDIMKLLDVIEDKVVDSVLMNTFPNMCGLNRRERDLVQEREDFDENNRPSSRALAHTAGHPSGFRFLKFEEVGKCTSHVNDVDFCAIFAGVVYVYGRHQNGYESAKQVMNYIDDILNASNPQEELHEEIIALSSNEEYSSITGNVDDTTSTTQNDNDGLSRIAILVIVIATLIVLAICYYVYIQWSERKLGDTMFSPGNSETSSVLSEYSSRSQRTRSRRNLWNKIFKHHSRKNQYKDYDPEERSIRPSMEVAGEDDFVGDSFVDEYGIDGISSDHRASVKSSSSSRGSNGRSERTGSSKSERQSSQAGLLKTSSSKTTTRKSMKYEDGLFEFGPYSDSKNKKTKIRIQNELI